MKPRKRLPISRACLFAAAALLSVAPKARAANVFFDADNATPAQLGAATVGATGTWSDAFWYDAGTATTATGDGAIATYIFTAADTAYFQGNKGTLTATAEQTITLNGINDSTGMTLSGGSLSLSGASIPPGSSCAIEVPVTSSTVGDHVNTTGAVSAAVQSIETRNMLPGTMQDIISAIQPAVVRARSGTGDNLLGRSIMENVKMQEQALETRPSLVQSMFRDKKIDIVGGVYDLASGKVSLV